MLDLSFNRLASLDAARATAGCARLETMQVSCPSALLQPDTRKDEGRLWEATLAVRTTVLVEHGAQPTYLVSEHVKE